MTCAELSAEKVAEAARKTLAKWEAGLQFNPAPRGPNHKRLQDLAVLAEAASMEAPGATMSVGLDDFALIGARVWAEVSWKELAR
jgi:hypothetical protein